MESWGRVFDPSLPGDVVPLSNKDLMQNRIPTIEISSFHCFTSLFFWDLCIILYGNCIQKVKVFFFCERLINKLGARHELKGQLCIFTYGTLSCWAFLSRVRFSHFTCVSYQTTTLRNTAGFMWVYDLISFVEKHLFSYLWVSPRWGEGRSLSVSPLPSEYVYPFENKLRGTPERVQIGVIGKETSRF